jgi:hypothetical protein
MPLANHSARTGYHESYELLTQRTTILYLGKLKSLLQVLHHCCLKRRPETKPNMLEYPVVRQPVSQQRTQKRMANRSGVRLLKYTIIVHAICAMTRAASFVIPLVEADASSVVAAAYCAALLAHLQSSPWAASATKHWDRRPQFPDRFEWARPVEIATRLPSILGLAYKPLKTRKRQRPRRPL